MKNEEAFQSREIIVKRIKPLRILCLLGIAILLFVLVMYADYTYGLRRRPSNLSNRRRTEHFHIYTDLDPDSLNYYEYLLWILQQLAISHH